MWRGLAWLVLNFVKDHHYNWNINELLSLGWAWPKRQNNERRLLLFISYFTLTSTNQIDETVVLFQENLKNRINFLTKEN